MRGIIRVTDPTTGSIHVYACIEYIGSVDSYCHGFTNGWAVGLLENRARIILSEALLQWWEKGTGGKGAC